MASDAAPQGADLESQGYQSLLPKSQMPAPSAATPKSSLSILLPATADNSKDGRSGPSSFFNRYRLDTGARLESLSKELIAAMHDQTGARLHEFGAHHVQSGFKAKLDNTETYSWLGYVDMLRDWASTCPRWSMNVIYAAADTHDAKGLGAVSLLIEVICEATHLRRLTFSLHKWRKRKGSWLCYETDSVQGVDLTACPVQHHHAPAGEFLSLPDASDDANDSVHRDDCAPVWLNDLDHCTWECAMSMKVLSDPNFTDRFGDRRGDS